MFLQSFIDFCGKNIKMFHGFHDASEKNVIEIHVRIGYLLK